MSVTLTCFQGQSLDDQQIQLVKAENKRACRLCVDQALSKLAALVTREMLDLQNHS